MTVQKGEEIYAIDEERILEVEGLWGESSEVVDFSAKYLPAGSKSKRQAFGNRGFRLQDEGVIWMKIDENKRDVLMFAMILEGDIFRDGYGTTEDDADLLVKAMNKIYGAKEDTPEEELVGLQAMMEDDAKNFVKLQRQKILNFLNA